VFFFRLRATVKQQFEPLKRITPPLAAERRLFLEPERLQGVSLMQHDKLSGAARCIPPPLAFRQQQNLRRGARGGDKNSNSMLLGHKREGDGCRLPALQLKHLNGGIAVLLMAAGAPPGIIFTL